MVLYLIGLGLFDEQDITLRWVAHQQHMHCATSVFLATSPAIPTHTCCLLHPLLPAGVRGLEAVRKCSRIYLEAYTSILLCEKEKLVGTHANSSRISLLRQRQHKAAAAAEQ